MPDPDLDAAIAQASQELGLEAWYRDFVRPLVQSSPEEWPRCCGGGCEPCSELLVRVAQRARAILGR